jgi:hypothetical protein
MNKEVPYILYKNLNQITLTILRKNEGSECVADPHIKFYLIFNQILSVSFFKLQGGFNLVPTFLKKDLGFLL